FIPHDMLRLDIYRRLSKCEDTVGVYEIFGEIEDRFGRADIYTKQFIDLMVIKVLAQNCGIKAISSMDENILITQNNGEKIRLKARTRDDDDVLDEILSYLRKCEKAF
ncbi:MAG: transcription-repair coupling factor, partial [Campylobacter sp.]|nr:transcription-repair coupling factor [Campylobacter sp.]